MTKDDIIRMAREAGFDEAYVSEEAALSLLVPLERLAAQAAALAAAAEREGCARVAELVAREIDDTNGTATYIAAAIRARGNK